MFKELIYIYHSRHTQQLSASQVSVFCWQQ